jgi:polyphosphate kinase
MSKDKQKKHEVVEAPDASGTISRKQFEEELAKLQVELTRLADLGQTSPRWAPD